jgi:hypothetical protein
MRVKWIIMFESFGSRYMIRAFTSNIQWIFGVTTKLRRYGFDLPPLIKDQTKITLGVDYV